MPITIGDLTDDQIDALKAQGFDPSKYSPETVLNEAESSTQTGNGDKMSVTRAAYTPLKAHAGGLIGGGIGGGAAMGALSGTELGPLGILVGGLIGGGLGAYGGQKAQEVVVSPEQQAELERQATQAYEEHPLVARGTELAAGAVLGGGRPSLKNLSYALGRNADNLAPEELAKVVSGARANVLTGNAINIGAQTGLNAAEQLYQTGTVDPKELGKSALEGAAAGALFTNPNWLGKTLNPRWHSVEDHIAALKESAASDLLDDQSPDHDQILNTTKDIVMTGLNGMEQDAHVQPYKMGEFQRVSGLVATKALPILDPTAISDALMLKNFKKLVPKVSSSMDITDQANTLAKAQEMNQMTNEQKRQFLFKNALENIHTGLSDTVGQYMTQSDSMVDMYKRDMLARQKITEEQLAAHQTGLDQQQQERENAFAQAEHERTIAQNEQERQMLRERNLAEIEQNRQATELEAAKNTGLATKERIAKTNIQHTIVKNQIAGDESREGEGTASKLAENMPKFDEETGRTPEEEIQDRFESPTAKFSAGNADDKIPVPAALTQHIQSGKATTGSVLQHFANEPGHQYQELASEALAGSHPVLLNTPWNATTGRPHFSTSGKVLFDGPMANHAGEILEEAMHSLQTRQIPSELLNTKGGEWYNHAQRFIANNPGHPVSELLKAYIETAKHMGLHKTLFGTEGETGDADKFRAEHGGSHVAYAMGDFAEFLAHTYRTKELQEYLNTIKSPGETRTMWQKVVDSIKSMLGLSPKAGSMLEHVLKHTAELHSMKPREEYGSGDKEFFKPGEASPERSADISKFDELGKTMQASEIGSDEFMKAWGEREKIKNKYGGMPPEHEVTKNAPKRKDEDLHPAQEGQDWLSKHLRNLTGAAIDKIYNIGVPEAKHVGDSFTKTYTEQKELQGKWWTKLDHLTRKLTTLQRQTLDKVLSSENRDKRSYVTTLRNQATRNAHNGIREVLKEMQAHQVENKQPVMRNGKPSMPIHDEWYYPTTEDLKAGDVIRQGTDTAKIAEFKKAFVENYASHHPTMKPEQVEGEWNEFVKSHQGSPMTNDHPDLAHFAAVRRQQGTPLPDAMRRTDPTENMFHYIRRASMDYAHYKNIESDPKTAAALGYTRDGWGNEIPQAKNVIHGNDAVKHVLNDIRGEIEPYSERSAKATEGFASAMILGPLTEIHKMAASAFQATIFSSNPTEFALSLTHAVKNMGRSFLHAEQNGLSVRNPQQIKRFTDANVTAAEKINLVAKALRNVYTFGGLTERVQLVLAQGTSEYLVGRKIDQANQGGATSSATMKQLDPDWVRGKDYSPEDRVKLASRMAGFLTGTRDARTMPVWMLRDTEISSFFKLMSWNTAQTNSFMKNAWLPATKGDLRPMMMTVFGASIGGYIIKELREKASGRPSPIASLADIAASSRGVEGNIPAVAYNWMSAASFGGLGGMISLAAKVPFDIYYRNAPQGMVFPLDEYATEYGRIAIHAADALINDPTVNPTKLAAQVANDLILNNTQLGRVVLNQAINAGVINEHNDSTTARELAYKRYTGDANSQLRRFEQVEGLPIPPNEASEANPYLNLEAKRFKHTQDIGEAVGNIQSILKSYIDKYHSSPDILMQKIKGLKENPLNVFPSVETNPIVFGRYMQFLTKEYGQHTAMGMLAEYETRKAINSAKGQIVP